jgi:hypothetical protein
LTDLEGVDTSFKHVIDQGLLSPPPPQPTNPHIRSANQIVISKQKKEKRKEKERKIMFTNQERSQGEGHHEESDESVLDNQLIKVIESAFV